MNYAELIMYLFFILHLQLQFILNNHSELFFFELNIKLKIPSKLDKHIYLKI